MSYPDLFLSTPSVGRATDKTPDVISQATFLSTPSVGRATFPLLVYGTRQYISIHALRGEGDFDPPYFFRPAQGISIHALRGEGDEAP